MSAPQNSMTKLRSIGVLLVLVTAGVLALSGCTRDRPEIPNAVSTFTVRVNRTGTPGSSPSNEVPALTPHVTPAEGQATATSAAADEEEPVSPRERGITEGTVEPTEPVQLSGDVLATLAAATPLPAATARVATTVQPAATAIATVRTSPTTYVVQAGDTMFAIARKHGVTVATLAAANGIDDPTAIRAGQELTIPAPSAAGGAQTGGGYVHTVQAGETLFGIAQKYGIPLNRLAEANGITNPSSIRAGQKLTIPSGGGTGSASSQQRVHVVQPGETLTAIAAKYGVTPAAIIQANALTEPNRIVSGQQLIIP
ncbi:MAG: LysM peptidoglycan-binding domain-containing protein [Caldilineales bacterium]|nr:LysM peptidoglycan-binding domain-containing protein [Caldilineales bacterium]